MRFGNRLIYSGYTMKGVDFADDFRVFETGVYKRESLGVELPGREVEGSFFEVDFPLRVGPGLADLDTT